MAPPALLPRAAARAAALTTGTLLCTARSPAPASSSPLRPARANARRPPRTARSISVLRAAPSNDDAAAGSTGPYAWPWGDEDPPDYVEEGFVDIHRRFARESKEAAAALKGAVADAFRPLVVNFDRLHSVKTVYDTEDYHIGMPFGALIACIGCYQLWKMDPSTCLDVVLGYAFYKLSVLASHVRRQGFSNDLLARLKFVIVVIMAVKDFKKKLAPIDAIRTPVYALYLASFLFDLSGLKKYAKYYLAAVIELLKTEEGRRVLDQVISKHNNN